MASSRVLGATARGSGGFTLIEIMVSFSALLVILLGFSRLLLSSRMASATTHEATIAKEGARAMLETLEAATFAEVFARYNADAGDDPASGTSPGNAFPIRGLDPVEGDADGLVGEILFPVIGSELREDHGQAWLFGPVDDLNGDGNPLGPDSVDHSGDYRLLPVVVRVSWRGSGGNGSVEFRSVLGNF